MKSVDQEFSLALGKILKQYRQKKNMSLFQLGEATNLNENNIGRLERGEHIPALKTYVKLAITLELEISDYFSVLGPIIEKEDM